MRSPAPSGLRDSERRSFFESRIPLNTEDAEDAENTEDTEDTEDEQEQKSMRELKPSIGEQSTKAEIGRTG